MNKDEWLSLAYGQCEEYTLFYNYMFEDDHNIVNSEVVALFEKYLGTLTTDEEDDAGELISEFTQMYGNVQLSGDIIKLDRFGKLLATTVKWDTVRRFIFKQGPTMDELEGRLKLASDDSTMEYQIVLSEINADILEEIETFTEQYSEAMDEKDAQVLTYTVHEPIEDNKLDHLSTKYVAWVTAIESLNEKLGVELEKEFESSKRLVADIINVLGLEFDEGHDFDSRLMFLLDAEKFMTGAGRRPTVFAGGMLDKYISALEEDNWGRTGRLDRGDDDPLSCDIGVPEAIVPSLVFSRADHVKFLGTLPHVEGGEAGVPNPLKMAKTRFGKEFCERFDEE